MKFVVAGFLITLLSACSLDPDGGPEWQCNESPAEVTLEADVFPVLTAKCALSGCHDSKYARTYGDYTSLESTAGIVGKQSELVRKSSSMKVVDPGDLHNSTLWVKVLGGTPSRLYGPSGEDVGGRMPQAKGGGEDLTESERELLRDWICTGAQ